MSKCFPTEFADLLNDENKAIALGDMHPEYESSLFKNGYGYKHFNPFSQEACIQIIEALQEHFLGKLNPICHEMPTDPKYMKKAKDKDFAPIPWTSHSAYYAPEDEWVDNTFYVEDAGSCMPCSEAFARAMQSTGLYDCFTSETYWNWLAATLGESLDLFDMDRDHGVQVSRYAPGDSIGLHNDYYGTKKRMSPFYDIHCSFAHNVAHQYMLFGDKRLDKQVDLTGIGSIGIYRLPLWHQVTPLIPKDESMDAYRWLIISDLWYKE